MSQQYEPKVMKTCHLIDRFGIICSDRILIEGREDYDINLFLCQDCYQLTCLDHSADVEEDETEAAQALMSLTSKLQNIHKPQVTKNIYCVSCRRQCPKCNCYKKLEQFGFGLGIVCMQCLT
jgi:hypothetical protein